ncbi:MAG: ABC transporter ATP-binding protein [Gemmatimonadota bacterium]|nr:MAG: ABC transporter ATP-binding protein [Gemmatimonadota bacterium]
MMIEVDGLCRVSGGRRVLDGVTFRVDAGEVVGFLGQNGAGKTTTLRILAGALPKSGGIVRVCGFDSPQDSPQARRQVGYLPENVPVVGDVTALEYVEFVARSRGARAQEARHDAAARLEQVDLTGVGHRSVQRLSKGQRQRVGLAAALAGDPPVLLLDEPSSGLDPSQLVRVRELIREQRGRRAVLVSTHLLSEVRETCDRVIVLHQGRVVAEETASSSAPELPGAGPMRCEVVVRGDRAGVRELLESVAGVRVIDVDRRAPGEVTVIVHLDDDRRAELAAAVVQSGRELVGLRPLQTTLEEMFLRLVAGSPGGDLAVRS